MNDSSVIDRHREETRELANSLSNEDVYHWLLEHGYYPENYVLPPCFKVVKHPESLRCNYNDQKSVFKVDHKECLNVHYPKTELTDRNFGIIHPHIHNDIAYHIVNNWESIVKAMIPVDSMVASYSFPIPVDRRNPGRPGYLKSGRMIYEFITMTDDDLVSMAYKYTHLVRADIKNFYPSIYTHGLAWALHGKEFIRKKENMHNFEHYGNRLDRLFQCANDGCTNGLLIGPVVSDIAAEIIASAVDKKFTSYVKSKNIDCEAVRFKDDYRILVKSEGDGIAVIKELQSALKEFKLELSDEKTNITKLPDGLFREWVSKYHAVHPKKSKIYSWKQFRELCLAVIAIDKSCPGTGVIDRFLADIVSKKGRLKVEVNSHNVEKVVSMLLMLATLRVKAFPKVIAILESLIHHSSNGKIKIQVVKYLEIYLNKLMNDEDRYKYLISWIGYFLVSNDLIDNLDKMPVCKDPITRSIIENQNKIFEDAGDFILFLDCKEVAQKQTMLEYLEIFNSSKW